MIGKDGIAYVVIAGAIGILAFNNMGEQHDKKAAVKESRLELESAKHDQFWHEREGNAAAAKAAGEKVAEAEKTLAEKKAAMQTVDAKVTNDREAINAGVREELRNQGGAAASTADALEQIAAAKR